MWGRYWASILLYFLAKIHYYKPLPSYLKDHFFLFLSIIWTRQPTIRYFNVFDWFLLFNTFLSSKLSFLGKLPWINILVISPRLSILQETRVESEDTYIFMDIHRWCGWDFTSIFYSYIPGQRSQAVENLNTVLCQIRLKTTRSF